MSVNVLQAVTMPSGPAPLSAGGQVSTVIQEGCNVLNGTIAGAVLGVAICPIGGAEIGAAIGGWIGSKLSEDTPPAGK